MSAPRLHLEIDAVWENGKWRIVDAEGEPCQVLSEALLRFARPNKSIKPKQDRVFLDSDTWNRKCQRLASRIRERAREHEKRGDSWERKCQSMAVGIRTAAKDVAMRRSYRRVTAHEDWESRCTYMAQRIADAGRRARRVANGWTKWSETTSRNLRKRATRKSG